MARLRALLEDDDSDALEALDAVRAAVGTTAGPLMREIAEAIEGYDFEAGLAALDRLAAALEDNTNNEGGSDD